MHMVLALRLVSEAEGRSATNEKFSRKSMSPAWIDKEVSVVGNPVREYVSKLGIWDNCHSAAVEATGTSQGIAVRQGLGC
jgi:hypothetical protein